MEASIKDLGAESRERQFAKMGHGRLLGRSERILGRENSTATLQKLSLAGDEEGNLGCSWGGKTRVTCRNQFVQDLGGKGSGFHPEGKRCNSINSF